MHLHHYSGHWLTRRAWLLAYVVTIALGASPRSATAQRPTFIFSVGAVTPVAPSSSALSAGPQLSLGVSRDVRSNLAVGLEGSYAMFGNQVEPPVPDKFGLLSLMLTGRYRVGTGALHPYVGAAAGIAQEHLTVGNAPGTLAERNGSARVTLGLERDAGQLRWGVETGYATVATLKYRNRFVRYVPITFHVAF
jgi:hypothetical protein